MLITAAEERKKGMTALYIDGEYAVSIDTVTLAASGFRTGSAITDEELYELLEQSKISRAKEKALYLIEYRSRTRKELYDKLVPLYGDTAAERALARLEELGLIDDERFARDYAEQLLTRKHFSRDRAVYELMKKGVDKTMAQEIADQTLEEFELSPEDQIRQLLDTRFARKLSHEKDRARTVNSLKAMGFRWSDIKDVLSEYDEEED